MKLAALILGELAIAGLLAVLVFVVLLYQPAWIWIAAPLVMLGGFVGIIAWAKSDPARARLLTLLCPLAYTVWLLGLGLSIQSGGIIHGAFPPIGSQLSQKCWANIAIPSLVAQINGAATTWSYDTASRLDNLAQDVAAGSGDVAYSFTYNPASQVLTRNISNDNYGYVVPTLSRTYERNGLNQYTSVSETDFEYDARGNLVDDGTRTFTYDSENHLTSVNGGPAAMTLSYDPLGRLQSTTTSSGLTWYIYDGDRLMGEAALGGAFLRRYAHGAGLDEPLIWYEGTGVSGPAMRWLLADHQGSIVAHVSDGGTADAYAYGPYGEPDATNGWSGARFRYTGQIMLPEAQLYHYKARVYDPALGRFLQTDPVGYADDLNLYLYVSDDPVNRTDPTGLSCTSKHSDTPPGGVFLVVDCRVDEILPAEAPGKRPHGRRAEANRQYRQEAATRAQARVEQEYTRTVRQLLRHPNRRVMITIAGRRVRVTAGQVAAGLMSAHVRLDPNNRGGYAYTIGGGASASGRQPVGQRIITLEPRAFNDSGPAIRATFAHEGLHTQDSMSTFLGTPNWDSVHADRFDDAAEELLR